MGKHLTLLPGQGALLPEEPSAYWLMRAAPMVLRGPEGGRIMHWADPLAAARLLAIDSKDLPQSEAALVEILGAKAGQARQDAFAELSYDGATYSLVYGLLDEKGQTRWIEERGQRLGGNTGGADHISAAMIEVSSKFGHNQGRDFHSRYDDKTGFASREVLAEHFGYYQRFDQCADVFLVQINNLSDIEMDFGAEAADYYTQAIARRMEGEFSDQDFKAKPSRSVLAIVTQDGVTRNGGIKSSDEAETAPALKRLNYILSQIPVASPFGTVPLDCTILSLTYTPDQDAQMFVARMLNGQEDVEAGDKPASLREPAGPIPASQGPAFVLLESEIDAEFINRAISEQRICLAFQPIVSAQSGELSHYEVLMRYKHDEEQILSAAPLILAAEKLGLIHKLDILVLEMSRDVLLSQDDVRLALNISAATVARMDMMSAYLMRLTQLGADTSRIIIELTETMALENPEQANQFAIRLQTLGCQFAIDDFGTGYTSFQNLLNLEAQIIKIDGSFIQDIAYREQKQSYVRLVVEMAQTFGLKTVAEMIDNEQDANMCIHLGVDYLQGYYLGRPQLDI